MASTKRSCGFTTRQRTTSPHTVRSSSARQIVGSANYCEPDTWSRDAIKPASEALALRQVVDPSRPSSPTRSRGMCRCSRAPGRSPSSRLDRIATMGGSLSEVPAGTNRTLRLAARAAGFSRAYRCSGARYAARAAKASPIVLTPEEVSNGRSVRLRRAPTRKGNTGRAIVIQARATGSRRWATVRVVRTNRHGRFGMKYRFLSTYRTVTYAFRARVEAGQAGTRMRAVPRSLRRVRVYGA